jgi:LysM repeat protein
MRHSQPVAKILFFIIFFLLTWNWAAAQEVTPAVTPEVAAAQPLAATAVPVIAAPSSELTYIVRPGETLFRIALRFHTTVKALAETNKIANPALIYAGQQLHIPGVAASTATPLPAPIPTVLPTATPAPVETTSYTVQRGDTLFRVAVRFHTTLSRLVSLNNLSNPNLIYVGQVLKIPVSGTATQPTVTNAVATAQPAQVAQTNQGGGTVTGYGFSYGIEAFLVDKDVAGLTGQITSLGMKWVKQTINWRDFEPAQGQIDFATLDNIVNTLHNAGLNILFTVTAAPAWARTTSDENGPPDNTADYAAFMTALAGRYAGKVNAYEIWNEPNLRREWNSKVHPLGVTSYIELLSAAYNAVKAADPTALVLSAGLAPTGFNDKVNAADDRQFLKDLYTTGLAKVSDAVGAHPLGWANPPDSVCCAAPVGVETHYESPSFFFRNTLDDYRKIMVAAGDGSTPIWVTKFGWGTSDDTNPPSSTNVFITYTTLGEQAIYDPRAFELGTEFGYVGPMFLDNLNGCQIGSDESCYYALIGPDNTPRPVFAAVQTLINPTAAPQPIIVEPTAAPVEVIPTTESLPQETLPEPETTVSP